MYMQGIFSYFHAGAAPRKKQGVATLLLVLVVASAGILIVATVVFMGVRGLRQEQGAQAAVRALAVAEAGAEEVLGRLGRGESVSSPLTLAVGAGTAEVTNTTAGNITTIESRGDIDGATRAVRVTMRLTTDNVSFFYGVHVGAGGLEMDQGSRVVAGSVYANGTITGLNGAVIEGDAFSAEASGVIRKGGGGGGTFTVQGSANAHLVENVEVDGDVNAFTLDQGIVGGNVSADTLSGTVANCQITGDAAFNTNNTCDIAGTETTPNPSVPADPATEPFPIDQATIDDWEQDALDGGEIIGDFIVDVGESKSLGPKKVSGKIIVRDGGTLTVTGTLWAETGIELLQNSTIRLSSGYGSNSGIVMAGDTGDPALGTIVVENNAIVFGSGDPDSYLMLLSQRDNDVDVGIDAGNNSDAAVFYAKDGYALLRNNADVREVTAYRVKLDNNSTLTYESGLANANFSSGPGGGFRVLSWEEYVP